MHWVLLYAHVHIIRSNPSRIPPKLRCPCKLSAFFYRGRWQFRFAQKMSFISLLVPGVSKLFLKLPGEVLVDKRALSSVGLLGAYWLHQQTGNQSLPFFPNWGRGAVNSFWVTAIYLVKSTNSLAEFPGYLTVRPSLFLNQKMADGIAWPVANNM